MGPVSNPFKWNCILVGMRIDIDRPVSVEGEDKEFTRTR
jgi:hypothetical protein